MNSTRLSLQNAAICLFTLVLLLALGSSPTQAQIPQFATDPPDGGTFTGVFTISFFQPMQDPIAVSFANTGGVSFNANWLSLPGLPKMVVECKPNGVLPVGTTVTWTINPSGTGFTTQGGEVISTASGTFVVGSGGGTGGGGGIGGGGETPEVPPCPGNSGPRPFPKTVFLCGDAPGPWQQAALLPAFDGSHYVLDAIADGPQGTTHYLAFLDQQGQFTHKINGPLVGTRLWWTLNPQHLAAQHLAPGENILTVGLYNRDQNLTPLFEKSLALAARDKTDVTPLRDGRLAIVQDLSTQIEVVVLTSNGAVAWAKRYGASVFGGTDNGLGGIPGIGDIGGIGGFGPQQTASLIELPEGLLLTVTKSEISLAGPSASDSITLVRLSEEGAVQWARTYSAAAGFMQPFVSPMPNGDLYLEASNTGMVGESFETSSSLVALDATGQVRWGQRISGASLGGLTRLPNGDLLLSGITGGFTGTDSDSVFITVQDNGQWRNQVSMYTGSVGFSLAIPNEDRLCYTMLTQDSMTNDPTSPRNVVVGMSSLTFTNWQWKQYQRQATNGLLMPAPDNNGYVLSVFYRSDRSLDMIKLDQNLNANAPCPLFQATTLAVQPGLLVPTSFSPTSSSTNVTVSTVNPTLTSGHITLEQFNCAEVPICD